MTEQKHTEFAMKALDLADLFKMMVGGLPLDGKYMVELSAPDGPSTAGGKQALQHIKLVPQGGGSTIVAGSASRAENFAEIRTYEHLQALHSQRFKGQSLPLGQDGYENL